MAKPFVSYSEHDRLQRTSALEFLLDLFRWLLIIGVTLLVLALLQSQLTARPGHEVRELREGSWWAADAGTQVTAGQANRMQLPHDWRGNKQLQQQRTRSLWYRLPFSLERVDGTLWGVYLPSVSMNAEVYVNGEFVGDGGSNQDPISRNWNRPLYFPLPGSLLREQHNEVRVRVISDPAGTGLLGRVYVRPAQNLVPYFERRKFVKITLPIVASMATALLAFAVLLIATKRTSEPVYAWYGWGTLIWSVHNLNLFVVEPPLPAAAWDLLWFLSLGWFVLMIPPYVHGLLGYERPRTERTLFAAGGVGTVILVVLAVWDHYWLDWFGRRVWDSAALAVGVYPTFMMARAVWRSRDVEVQWLLATGLLIFVLGLRDCLVTNELIPRTDGYMIQYSAPFIITVFGWLLLSRFVRASQEAEQLNRELHARVEARTAELQLSFEKLGVLERERAIQEERGRILRDMHDGVGSSLSAAIAGIEGGKANNADLAEALRDSLEELRLTIDSVDLEHGDLESALGNLRARLRSLGEHSVPVLIWEIMPLSFNQRWGPAELTDIVRIMREAISNAVRHAGASLVRIRVSESRHGSGQLLRIVIEDDGCGMPHKPQSGHGLNNMRRRAEQLRGRLEILSNSAGTRVELSLRT